MELDDYYVQKFQELLNRLRAARLEAGLTQEEVAERLGTSQSFVSRSETGESAYSDEIDHVFRPCRPPVGAKRR